MLLDQAGSFPLDSLPVTGRGEATIRIAPGSTLVLYTDGLVERRGEDVGRGVRRLVEAVTAARSLDVDQLTERIMRDVLPEDGHEDDVAVLVYRHPGAVVERFAASIIADPSELAALRSALSAWLRRAGVEDRTATDALIACGEACANSLEHAYGFRRSGVVQVEASIAGDRLEIVVRDTGVWRHPSGEATDRGRGLDVMKALMDDIAVGSTDGGGTVVRLGKRLGSNGR